MLKLNVNPEKYVKTQARSLPIVKCLINEDWMHAGVAHIIVVRQHKTLNLTVGMFMVDLHCLGLKDTFFEFNIHPDELKEMVPNVDLWKDCDYPLAHNIIYGGIDFAEDYGFRPYKGFAVTQFLLEEDDDKVELIDVEFGLGGIPCYIPGPFDDPVKVRNTISTLERKAGAGNFRVVFPEDLEDLDEDDDFDDDEDLEADLLSAEVIKMTNEINSSYDEAFRSSAEVESLMDYPIAQDYEITWDPIESKYNQFDSEEHEKTYIRLHQLVIQNGEAKLAIPQLKKAIAKWPGNPLFYNLLQSAYATNDDVRASDATIKEMFKLFPDYLFAKISYANMLIDSDKAEQAFQVFKHNADLNQQYPERNLFHFTEVAVYFGTLCRYYVAIGDIDLADAYMHALIKNELIGLSGQTVVNMAMAELLTAKIARLNKL